MRRSWSRVVAVVTFGLLSGVASAAPEVDFKALAEAGQRTLRKLETAPASWTVTVGAPGAADVAVIHVSRAAGMRRLIFSGRSLGVETEVARVTERDGVWYAAEGNRRAKYRPYEAGYKLAAVSLSREVADLRVVPSAEFGAGAQVLEAKNGVATVVLPPPNLEVLENLMKQLREMVKQSPSPENEAKLKQLEATMRAGIRGKFDLANGVILESDTAQLRVTVSGLTWPEKANEADFAVAGEKWEDLTDDPTAGDLTRLAMIGHDGHWNVGAKSPYPDGELVDLTTGRSRRIPFEGSGSLPGCFARGRKSVFVSGVSIQDGAFRLYEVNLSTGRNRLLGGDALATGMTMMPALSPDGKTIACLHKDLNHKILDSQIYLVDVASGEAKPLGKEMDVGFLSWEPDGKGLIGLTRETVRPQDGLIGTVCHIDLKGDVRRLFKGDDPLVLDGRTLLSCDRGQPNRWYTSDLTGANRQLLAEDLPNLSFPTSSPDGKRVLMMLFEPGHGPQPVILKPGERELHPVPVGEGLWMAPAWR